MTLDLKIVDYGIGNLRSIRRAFSHIGVSTTLTRNEREIISADRLIVPGVGAFGKCMSNMNSMRLSKAVKNFAHSGRPVLGICVGMQMFFDQSSELGINAGLGLIDGEVQSLREIQKDEKLLSPFIGWQKLLAHKSGSSNSWSSEFEGKYVYFVHSYAAIPTDTNDIFWTYRMGNKDIIAAVKKGNILGLQFHPEKSGSVGLSILSRWLGI